MRAAVDAALAVLGIAVGSASLVLPSHWNLSEPVLSPAQRPEDPCYSVKDPTIVRWDGRWHLFCTIRSKVRTHQIEYVSFRDWKDANAAPRHILSVRDGYFCAPQVFYFRPHKSGT
ncbi:MAG: hypothetical protein ACUVTZ_03680 [Armatimonadota bacterium]